MRACYQHLEEKMEKLMKIAVAADLLGISQKTVRKWVYERKINVVKVGGAVRIAESEIDRIMTAGQRNRIAL